MKNVTTPPVPKTIPLIDMRGKSYADMVIARPQDARAIITSLTHSYGLLSRAAAAAVLPALDRTSHKWLKQTGNPYLQEIEAIADAIGIRGAYTFNVCYQWACTTGVFATNGSPTLLRVLDWGFPNLGSNVTVVRKDSMHGDYFNVTWPGYVGSVNAMAPGRFAAAINIAPERNHRLTRVGDWIKNKRLVSTHQGLPPDHLLRKVFEEAPDYDSAKAMLMSTPIMAPVIYSLSGIKPGQGCIIERLERSAAPREIGTNERVTVSNHFHTALPHGSRGWRPRGVNSHDRYTQSCSINPQDLQANDFNWLQAPIVNWETRLALIANAATGRLMVQGFEGEPRTTEVFHLPPSEVAGR